MNEMTPAELAERLEKVERRARRLNRIALWVPVAILVLCLAGFQRDAQPLEVRNYLVLRDDQGAIRAILKVDAVDGRCYLSFFDGRSEKSRLHIGLRPDGSADMGFHQSDGTERLRFLVAPTDDVGISLSDQHGNRRLDLAVTNEHGGSVVLKDPDGTDRYRLGFGKGVVSEALFDVNGKERLGMSVFDQGDSYFLLFGGSPQRRAWLSATPAGDVEFQMIGSDEKRRITLGIPPDGPPSLQLIDRELRPVVTLP